MAVSEQVLLSISAIPSIQDIPDWSNKGLITDRTEQEHRMEWFNTDVKIDSLLISLFGNIKLYILTFIYCVP